MDPESFSCILVIITYHFFWRMRKPISSFSQLPSLPSWRGLSRNVLHRIELSFGKVTMVSVEYATHESTVDGEGCLLRIGLDGSKGLKYAFL